MDARLITTQKMKTADLVIFNGEILNGKLQFCAVCSVRAQMQCSKIGQKNFCVSHFCLISRLIQKIRVDQTEKMILLTPT